MGRGDGGIGENEYECTRKGNLNGQGGILKNQHHQLRKCRLPHEERTSHIANLPAMSNLDSTKFRQKCKASEPY